MLQCVYLLLVLNMYPRDVILLVAMSYFGEEKAFVRNSKHLTNTWNHMGSSLRKANSLHPLLTVKTACLTFLLALYFLNWSRFTPRSFPAKSSSLPVIHGSESAALAVKRLSGLTVNSPEIKSLASEEISPQYSGWNSYCPFLIFEGCLEDGTSLIHFWFSCGQFP